MQLIIFFVDGRPFLYLLIYFLDVAAMTRCKFKELPKTFGPDHNSVQSSLGLYASQNFVK